jgi:6-phosphofructokinase
MALVESKKGVIGILTGGGDVPGLNPAIRAVTIRALREGYQVIGIRRGWAGLVDMVRDKDANDGVTTSHDRRDCEPRGADRRHVSAYVAQEPEQGEQAQRA